MCSDVGDTTQLVPGFPIRTPSDHSSVDSSPRPIAASHVLHRLLMPRHPPCALKHLTTTRCSHPLCNTQHTTTPQPERRHHNHTPQTGQRTALGRPGRERHREPHPQVSPQDPTVCEPAKTVQNKQQKCSTQPHPRSTSTRRHHASIRCGISERRDTHPSGVHIPTSPNGETP